MGCPSSPYSSSVPIDISFQSKRDAQSIVYDIRIPQLQTMPHTTMLTLPNGNNTALPPSLVGVLGVGDTVAPEAVVVTAVVVPVAAVPKDEVKTLVLFAPVAVIVDDVLLFSSSPLLGLVQMIRETIFLIKPVITSNTLWWERLGVTYSVYLAKYSMMRVLALKLAGSLPWAQLSVLLIVAGQSWLTWSPS